VGHSGPRVAAARVVWPSFSVLIGYLFGPSNVSPNNSFQGRARRVCGSLRCWRAPELEIR